MRELLACSACTWKTKGGPEENCTLQSCQSTMILPGGPFSLMADGCGRVGICPDGLSALERLAP